MGDASVFPPLQSVLSPPAGRVLGDTAGSLLQCTDPVSPALHSQSSRTRTLRALLRGGGCRCFQAFSTPHLRYVFPCSTLCFLYRISFTNGSIYRGYQLWVLRTIRSGYTLQFGRNPPCFDGVHLTLVNSASKASVLRQELSSLLQKGAIEEVPQSDIERGFFSRYFLVPKRDGGLRPILDLRRLNFSLYKGKFKMLTMKTIMSQVQGGDWFVTIDLKDAYIHIQVVQRHRRFLRFAFGGKAYQYKVLPFGLALAPRTFTKCMDAALAPLRLQGIRVLNYLDDWLILAHSRELVSRHRDIVLRHIHSLGLRMNAKKSVLLTSQQTVFLGVRLDSVQMQARLAPARIPDFTACLARFKLGHYVSVGTSRRLLGLMAAGLPCVAPRVTSHEAILLVDEGAEVTPHCTSHSPYQGVAQLLSTPFTMVRPRFSPERGENGCDPPPPYDHDGRINDRLGRGLRRQTGERRVDGRVPLLAYKLPGTQGCLPGFDVFSPRSRGVSYHSQNGQYGGCVSHKPSGRFTVAHPGQACTPSSPLVPGQVPLFEGGSRSGNTEPCGRFSVETEAQAGGMDVEPSDGIPDLGSVWRSGGGPLCFSRVIPVPALVLPEFRPSMAECQSVRVLYAIARLLLIATFWPSQTWFSELTPLLYRSPWEIPL